MQKRKLPITVLSICFALSCAVRQPEREVTAAAVASEAPTRETSAADEIEALLSRYMTGLAPFELRRTAEAVVTESKRNRIDPQLVLAVMHTESGYYNFARSPVGALGLMQIMPATGEMLARRHGLPWSGPETLFDPVANVRLGCRYLAFLRERYGRIDAALAAYNWGPGAIDRRLARGSDLPRRYPSLVLARVEPQPPAAGASAR
jgi:soluble lytic murein transglycosylase-like protein